MELSPHHWGLGPGMHPGVPQCTETTENQDESRFGAEAPCKDRFDGETDFFSVLLPKPPLLTDPGHGAANSGENKAKSFFRFNTQNPGSSIKQQKLNVISSRGTATLLTAVHV